MYGEDEDTDDEIEKIREKKVKQEAEIKQEKVKQETEVKNSKVKQETDAAYDLDTDDEIEDIKQKEKVKEEKNDVVEEAAYDQETDEEIDEKQSFKVKQTHYKKNLYSIFWTSTKIILILKII